MWKNSEDNFVEKQRQGDALPDDKPYHKSVIIKIVYCWHRSGQIN